MSVVKSWKTLVTAGLVASGLLLSGCASEPKVDTNPESVNEQGLSPVVGDKVKESFVNLEADFAKYTAYQVEALNMSETVVKYRPDSSDIRGRSWELDDRDRDELKGMYNKAMTENLVKGGHSIAEQAGEGVMVISASLLKLEPKAPKDDSKGRFNDSNFYTEGAGKVTIAMEFRDSVSGELLATVLDRRDAGRTWQENNYITNKAEVQRLFNRWARLLASSLDHAKAE